MSPPPHPAASRPEGLADVAALRGLERAPEAQHDTRGSYERGREALARVLSGPSWSLRIEGQRLAVVLERAALPGGAELAELVFGLPHVAWPFDFREGLDRFRHQRGAAEELALRIDARLALDWLYRVTGGAIGGSARDDALVLVGRTEGGTRYTVRARLVADERDPQTGEPLLQLSLYQCRVYGPVDVPWPALAGRILDALPADLVVDRTLTTARLRLVRRALAFGLASLGWKIPDVATLESRGVELREGRFTALFASATTRQREVITLGLDGGAGGDVVQTAFERFIEDLELKRHHGQIDRLIAAGQFRDALSEVYRAIDGPLRPGFLAERLIGICASQPILFDEGERICFGLLETSSDYPQALCGLGAIARARGRPEEAAMYFERLAASLSGPGEREDATAADLAVADCLRDFSPEQARIALERVLARAPDHEEALSERIAMAEAEGDMRTAMPLYKRLLFSARSQARTREAGLRLARFALERGEPEDARVLLRVVLEAAPDDLDAQMALADVEAGDGHAGEAVRILEAALRALPPQDTPRVLRVIVRLAQVSLDLLADPGRARRILWRAGDFARLGDASLRELAQLSVRARDPALALRFIELIPASSAEWSEGQTLRAEALLLRGDAAAALRSVLAVLGREPDHEEALRLLEKTAPDPEQRQWLVAELLDSAARAVPGEPRARVLHRVAAMYISLGLPWDAIAPLGSALAEAPASARFEERASLLMGLHQQFGMWSDFLRIGALRLPALRGAPPSDEAAQRLRTGLLVDLGRAALRELDDPRGARGWLEEATRLAPRHLPAHELLAESLAAGPEREAMEALSHVLMRLESIRPDEVTRDTARLQLAELQLAQLGAPVLARATLQRVSPARRLDPWALALEQEVAARLDGRRSPAGRAPGAGGRDAVDPLYSPRSVGSVGPGAVGPAGTRPSGAPRSDSRRAPHPVRPDSVAPREQPEPWAASLRGASRPLEPETDPFARPGVQSPPRPTRGHPAWPDQTPETALAPRGLGAQARQAPVAAEPWPSAPALSASSPSEPPGAGRPDPDSRTRGRFAMPAPRTRPETVAAQTTMGPGEAPTGLAPELGWSGAARSAVPATSGSDGAEALHPLRPDEPGAEPDDGPDGADHPTDAPAGAIGARVDTRTRLATSPRPVATRPSTRADTDPQGPGSGWTGPAETIMARPRPAAAGAGPGPEAASEAAASEAPAISDPPLPMAGLAADSPASGPGLAADSAAAPQEPNALPPAPAGQAAGIARRAAEMDAIEGLLAAASEHFFEGRLGEAREALLAVLAVDADVVPALELLAAVSEAAGDGPAQAAALGHLIRNTFDTRALARLSQTLATVLDGLGRPDEALEHHARYLQLEPFDEAHWASVSSRLPAGLRGELLEARVDAAEDAGLPELRTRALLDAARAHADAGHQALAADAAGRLRVAEAGLDPELLLGIFEAASTHGVSPLRRAAADALRPLLLPGPDLDAVLAALNESA